jgi:NAD(P)-dependent dehydrogenase (short-subunit alcohol dehydrogenase family)
MDRKRFDGACVIITGGAGDIGLATARYLADEGAHIALIDVKGLDEAANSLKEIGAVVRTYSCDVTDYSAVEKTVERIATEFGRIDHLFNNAGVQGEFAKVHLYPVDDFAKVIEINLVGLFHVLKAVSLYMADHGGGSIVNTASMAGVAGPVNMAAYGASKAAIIGLTKTAAKDLAPYKIRVNAISPGFMGPGFMWDRQVDLQAAAASQYYDADRNVVAQQMINEVPQRRYGAIEEIPPTVAFLLSEESSYSTGINIRLSGGI